jgi:hypothetical protein
LKVTARTALYVNALVHHHAVDNLDPDEAADHLIAVVEDANPESVTWVREQIHRITAELGD